MSASGTGIFDDDVACNIRTQYRMLLTGGKVPADATRDVLRDWQEALADAEDGPVIWLALAAIQCQYGCLQPRVKARAMAAIDRGADIEHWRATGDPALVRSRSAVLARLRAKLESPPPARVKLPVPPRKRREPFRDEPADWPRGEVVAYRLRSGRYILLHVCDHLGCERTGWAPMVALIDWRGKRIPPAERIQGLPYVIRTDDPVEKHSVLMFSVGRARANELPQDRVIRHAAKRPAAAWKKLVGFWGGCKCSRWRDLDRDLEEWLGWT
jgi:hypothetical protein